MKAADDVATEIRSAGYLVNNCFEIDGGAWRANLRRVSNDPTKPDFYGFALGMTMADALQRAFEKAVVTDFAKAARPPEPVQLEDDLTDLI